MYLMNRRKQIILWVIVLKSSQKLLMVILKVNFVIILCIQSYILLFLRIWVIFIVTCVLLNKLNMLLFGFNWVQLVILKYVVANALVSSALWLLVLSKLRLKCDCSKLKFQFIFSIDYWLNVKILIYFHLLGTV